MGNNLKIHSSENIDIDSNEDINIDFSSADNFEIGDVQRIADIHRIALLNGKKLYIKNAAPDIMNILAITGLSKSFANFDDNFGKPLKRQRGF